MFISKREAEERLAEERNIFRKPLTPSGPTDARRDISESGETDCDETEPKEGDDGLGDKPRKGKQLENHNLEHQGSEAGRVSARSNSDDNLGLSLSHLDALLYPKVNGRAQYRGKLESQVAIAESELILGEAMTSRVFGLSVDQTDAYSKGLTSTADITNHTPPKPELISRIVKIKAELAEKAASRLDLTLNALSPTKIAQIKRATNLSKVAKDMAVILDKCTDTKEETRNVHFHIFVPDAADAEKYPTIDVGPSIKSPTE